MITPKYKPGDSVLYEGVRCVVKHVGIYERETPGEHVLYDLEADGSDVTGFDRSGEMIKKRRENELEDYQQSFF
ncbi:hypothetical protein CR161_03790 [Prosthecochloris sp. ZM]|uniref:hypothetical protein n=1 Tax=Prosthecochloris sp. ZM TaxID=2283143 RepID=UPI000DF78883|nr:hypothetical protein [Prosthecochloris sp. ZM]RDD29899.1 hypothetical protein CR161_03790 [Prosthecochloris sp. ZM]